MEAPRNPDLICKVRTRNERILYTGESVMVLASAIKEISSANTAIPRTEVVLVQPLSSSARSSQKLYTRFSGAFPRNFI